MSELFSIDDLNYKLPITNGIFVFVIVGYALPFVLSPNIVDNYLVCKSDLSLLIPSLDWINFFLSRIVFSDFKNYFFTLVLITIFRSFEKIYGSKKFTNYMFSNFCVSTILELSIINLLSYFEIVHIPYLANGCYSYIFALFVNYCKDIPNEKFDFFGIRFSEKLLVYFFGVQMLFTSYSVLIASLSGLIGGLICRSNAFNVCEVFHLPDRLVNFIMKCLSFLMWNNVQKESILNGATQSDRRQQYFELYEQNLLNDQLNFLNQVNQPTSSGPSTSSQPSNVINQDELDQNIHQLQEMGFNSEKAKQILLQSNNDLSRATNLLLEEGG